MLPSVTDEKHEKKDVVLLYSRTDDGEGTKVLRAREGGVETGEVRPLKEGKPISGEVVTLKPREEAPYLCDVEVAMPAKREKPSQVATQKYRDNWDKVFGPN
jgi:hypothetical protein